MSNAMLDAMREVVEDVQSIAPKPRGRRSMAGHEKPGKGATEDWITPPDILAGTGPFDLDPCACVPQPWPTATTQFALPQTDGLRAFWNVADIPKAFVWLNPPYGQPEIRDWMARMAEHNHGLALIFSRTETQHFERSVWEHASGLYFFYGRIDFFTPQGTVGGKTGGAPSVLISYGKTGLGRLIKYNALPAQRPDKTGQVPAGHRRPGKLVIP